MKQSNKKIIKAESKPESKPKPKPVSVFNDPSNSNDLSVAQIVELQRKSHADGTIKKLIKEHENETLAEFEKRIFEQAEKDKQDRNDKAMAKYTADTHLYMSRDGNKSALLEDSRKWDTALDNPPINKQPKLQNIKYFSKPTDGNPMDEFFYNWQQKWIRHNEPVNSVINDQRRDYGWRKRFLEGYHTDLANYRKSDEYKNVKDNLYPKFKEERDNKLKAEKEKEDEKMNKKLGIKPTEEKKEHKYKYEIVKSNKRADLYYYQDTTNNKTRWVMPEDNIRFFESSKKPGKFFYTDKDTNEQRWVKDSNTNKGGKKKTRRSKKSKKSKRKNRKSKKTKRKNRKTRRK